MSRCTTPCSDAAGTCSDQCPHLYRDLNEDGPALAAEERAIRALEADENGLAETLKEKKIRLRKAQKYERKREYFLKEQERRREHPEYYVPWSARFRCFWTWPWGHTSERGMTSYSYICLVCGAYIDKSSAGGGY